MTVSQTVSLEPHEDLPLIRMNWQVHAESQDIRQAFQSLLSLLLHSPKPVYLLIDLRDNVTMPLSETINSALVGAYTHQNLLACLIVGGHSRARIVASIIQRISHQNKIMWFKEEADAYRFLESKVAGNKT